jgi:hypothetical protein
VATLRLTVDGLVLASRPSPPYAIAFDTTTLTDGTHQFGATAVDGTGNRASASVTALVDNTAPDVTFRTPAPGAVTVGAIAVSVAASDGRSGLALLELRAGGAVVRSSTASPLDATINTAAFPDGPLLLSARAVDAAGNEATTALIITVDNTAPGQVLVSPTDGQVVSGVTTILAVNGDANLQSIKVYVDGALVGASSTSPLAIAFDTTARLDGAMVVTGVARDLAGNTTTSQANVTVDNVSVALEPTVFRLKADRERSQGGRDVVAALEGPQASIDAVVAARNLRLLVPGGNSVLATLVADWPGRLRVQFERAAVEGSLRAGIATGAIRPGLPVSLTVAAGNGATIGSALVTVVVH